MESGRKNRNRRVGEIKTLPNQVRKKIARNKSFDTIVEYESTPEIIRPLYDYDLILAEIQTESVK